jgi:hypothetical protein
LDNKSIEDDNNAKELQSQEMARGQYMIDEDASNNSYHECVQATTTPGNEEIVEEICCEPSLEDPLEERFDQFGGDLVIGAKYCIFDHPQLMFVKLLVLLISNVFVLF